MSPFEMIKSHLSAAVPFANTVGVTLSEIGLRPNANETNSGLSDLLLRPQHMYLLRRVEGEGGRPGRT